MSLLGLPNDLLLIILEFTFPESLVNTVLTCKHLYHLASPLLRKHNHYRELYEFSDVSEESEQLSPGHPLQLIYLILEDPEIAFYVRSLEYSPLPVEFDPRELMPDVERLLRKFKGSGSDSGPNQGSNSDSDLDPDPDMDWGSYSDLSSSFGSQRREYLE